MLRSLVSGSSGNCSLVSYKNTHILVDCGLSGKRLEQLLCEIGLKGCDLTAILITHEHNDHISGAGVISRRFNLPIYATCGTHSAMSIGRISDENVCIIEPDRPIEIGNIGVNAFCIPHDAADPVGYRFFCGGKKMSVATDIGIMTDEIFDSISGSDSIILEANHDIQMLQSGRYPPQLKSRILSNVGHMSNVLAASTALALARRGTKHIMLAHLSNENNTPKLAYDTVSAELKTAGATHSDLELLVADRYEVTQFK